MTTRASPLKIASRIQGSSASFAAIRSQGIERDGLVAAAIAQRERRLETDTDRRVIGQLDQACRR